MNSRLLSILAMALFQLLAVALMFFAIRSPERYGLILLGAVVGWMLYYFIRRYTLFSPKSLAATLSAIVGGEALAWLGTLRGAESGAELQYFTGLGAGFFVYALYAGFCSWLFALGYIKSPLKFEIAVGCGPGNLRDLDEIEELVEFEEKVQKWLSGELDDEQLSMSIDGLEMGRKKLLKYLSSGDVELPEDGLRRLREKGVLNI